MRTQQDIVAVNGGSIVSDSVCLNEESLNNVKELIRDDISFGVKSTDTVNRTKLNNSPAASISNCARYAISSSEGYMLQRESTFDTAYILRAADDICIQPLKAGIVETGLTVYISDNVFMHIEDHRRPIDKYQSFKVVGGFLECPDSGKLRIVLENLQNDVCIPIKKGDAVAHLVFSEISFLEPMLMDMKDFTPLLERDTHPRKGHGRDHGIPRYGPGVLLPVYSTTLPFEPNGISRQNTEPGLVVHEEVATNKFAKSGEKNLTSLGIVSDDESEKTTVLENDPDSDPLDLRSKTGITSPKGTTHEDLMSDDDDTSTVEMNNAEIDYWKSQIIENTASGYASSTDTEDADTATSLAKRIKLV
ncbi:unnamed protein product [Orchesella dallaii]|uniref:Uncharacterized protein n=1 Tax=Orchesella dallaii TaxID=48710 RepID=A0ABP1QED4_9HEXA